jgi:NTE family protein
MANDPLPIYFQDTRLATSRVRTRSMHFELGSEFGSWGEIRLGFENRLRDHFLTTQLPGQNAAHYRDVSLYGEAVYDQLDSLDFPRTGVYARGRFTKGLPSWGSSEPYTLGEFDLKTAYRWGAWSVLAAMQYHSANNAPADRTAVLGGLFKLSAYPTDSLRTTGHLFGRLQLSQDVARLAPVFGRAGFWGVSLEAARFRQEETLRLVNRDWAASATFFVGSDTRMGPAFFGVGISERGRGRIWLSINGNF